MNVRGQHYRTIWLKPGDERVVQLIDQRFLPHQFVIEDVATVEQMANAIREMHVRGAGLIGAAAGYGMYLATVSGADLPQSAALLRATRPTAVNLAWAIDRQLHSIAASADAVQAAHATAQQIADEDAEHCRRIGEHGLALLAEIAERKGGKPVNVLTHCNAGWLAFVDHGSATSPIYRAHDSGLPVHVWDDETRPRGQGSKLTAWELNEHGVRHTLIADNTGGHLMQRGEVDLVIVGTDRTTYTGDVANKIGTYLKALAAGDHDDIAEEIGDLLFAVVNLARKSKLEAETLLQSATDKFVRRFNALEDELRVQGKTLGDVGLQELDAIWNAQKASASASAL